MANDNEIEQLKLLMFRLKNEIEKEWDVYKIGLYNGMALSLGLLTNTEPIYYKSEVKEDG